MIRFSSFTSAALLGAAVLWPGTAPAQFGGLFGDPPPRPPASVPTRPPAQSLPPPAAQPLPPGTFQQAPPQSPPGAAPVARGAIPPASGIQSQSLAPPPGAPAEAPSAALRPAAPTLPDGPPGAARPPQAPRSTDDGIVPPPAQKVANPTAVFAGLDKITGRITSFDVQLNETVQFGALQVTPRACYTRPPTEPVNTDAFVEVSEVTLQAEVKRIFGGWMFTASPGLHGVEHPIYDVWLTDCKGAAQAVADAQPAPAPAPPPQARPAPQPRQPAQPRQQRQPAAPQQSAPGLPPPGFPR